MNQLSGEDTYILPGRIARQSERDSSGVMGIAAIIACRGDGIIAQWNIGEIVVA